jgi:hypothetical protein
METAAIHLGLTVNKSSSSFAIASVENGLLGSTKNNKDPFPSQVITWHARSACNQHQIFTFPAKARILHHSGQTAV